MAGIVRRVVLVTAGVMLGMALVAGHGFWHARPHDDLPAPPPAPSVPAGSYTAPGTQS